MRYRNRQARQAVRANPQSPLIYPLPRMVGPQAGVYDIGPEVSSDLTVETASVVT